MVLQSPLAEPASGFIDNSDPDYPGMDCGLLWIDGDDLPAAEAPAIATQGTGLPSAENEFMTFVTGHDGEFSRSSVTWLRWRWCIQGRQSWPRSAMLFIGTSFPTTFFLLPTILRVLEEHNISHLTLYVTLCQV